MTQDMNHTIVKALRAVLVVMMTLLTGGNALAQVTVRGNVYGGGNEADVQTNTAVNISAGQVDGNVYGGGNLGDVGNITKNTTNYNYSWKQTDGSTANAEHNNTFAANANNNTGISTVTISGGTIGTVGSSNTDYTQVSTGNVFGGGKGNEDAKFYCEEGMVYATSVTISNGTVYGCVYGGGEIGRVEDDTKVTITGTSQTGIKGNVFGAGKGLKTHGYSALVRGNTEVTVEGNSKIGHSVFGGGETASLGKFVVVGGNPATPNGGGGSTVTIQGSAEIGGDVFGAGKGVEPETYTYADKANMPHRMMAKSMGSFTDANSAIWTEVDDNNVWEYFPTSVIYHDFLRTLALASTPTVTIGGTATIGGSVYGGGELGITLGNVNVSMTGGTVSHDVYGGGALADTNTGNWSLNNYEEADANNLNDGETIYELFARTGEGTAQSPYKYSRYINSTLSTGQLYRRLPTWANATDKSSTYTTHVSLTGGTITGDAYGGGLGQKAREASGGQAALEDIEAMVYGDVKVELNGKTVGSTTTQVADDAKGCIVSRVFGCNNLNGTPKGHVKVYVYGTQSSGSGKNTIIDKYAKHSGMAPENDPTPYDVAAVYGGGNLAAYVPEDALLDYSVDANKSTVEAAKTEVYINGCSRTSIKQVYAGGNAASVSGSYVTVNSVYEIEEVFGGGNGADAYTLNSKKYLNPGANVGYYNYTHFGDSGKGTGTDADPYQPVDNTDASTKSDRQANYRYGSGIAETIIRGGKVHVVYGGSNKKGNISTTALSVYEGSDVTCPMSIDETYGGGKDAPIDGEVQVQTSCAHGIRQIFGGAKNADIDNDVNLKITNGSSLHQVFGGNNTSGAINGSITVTIEEGGCEPIRIDELYLGGYLAPYSVYGYQKTGDVYDTESVSYIDEDGVTQTHLQRIPLTSGSNPKQDPRINVISATYIGDIFGGGYQAKLVGNPHVNVNMEQGKVYVTKTKTENTASPAFEENGEYYVYKDGSGISYAQTSVTTEGTGDQTKYYALLPVGTIGNVYGGGYLANVVGDPYVEIGTGRWVSEWDANGSPIYESQYIDGNEIKSKYYKVKTPAVHYSSSECTSTNGSLTGAISISTELTATQATRLNELLSISTYSAGYTPSSEHAEAYNATLDGYVTTADIKTPAVWAWYTKNGENYSETTVPTPARNAATITGNVFGGGYGLADDTTFKCEKAMVGVEDEGADPTKRNGGTSVVIENGTVGGDVFGGGRLARVERNTALTIGSESGIGTPIIEGDVYGAGMGVDTHGYSGLVRGNATVTIQDDAKVRGNVYGGGEMASLGRFFVASTDALATAHGVEKGMPYDLKSGGTATVIIRGTAEIGPESGDANDNSGQVFGAGKGANPADISNPGRYYLDDNNAVRWESYAYNESDVDKTNKMAFHKYVLTLGITNKGNVIIDGGSTVKGSVYGGGKLGNVLSDTEVIVSAEKRTSSTTVSYVATSNQVNPTIGGNVYGGGKGLGDTFTCEKAMVGKDGAGVDANYEPTDYRDGNTTVVIGNGTVNGSVYGGGEVGRVEMNTSVTVGLDPAVQGGTSAPEILQSVFGGGKGLETHGYSALVRGNPTVTVQAGAKVRGNVYGGGQIASVARYRVAADDDEGAPYGVKAGMPYALADNNSGFCRVTVQGNAVIGPETFGENVKTTDAGHVFGAGKGIVPGPGGDYAFNQGTTERMVAVRNDQGVVTDNFHWDVFTSEADYITFVKTLALASNTNVTIDGNATVKGSVFGGSESGFVQFDTKVDVIGGTIGVQGKGGADFGNVYGGGKGDAKHTGVNVTYVDAGLVKGKTEVEIEGGTIIHNIYGGGAYGTVGEFAYDANGLPTGRRTYTVTNTETETTTVTETTGGKAKITITGGTIGTTGRDNGMVFGSSRGDVGAPGAIHDKLAWVYETDVVIGTQNSSTGPQINGSVYGGGENGHVFNDAEVTVHSGTIGIESGENVTVTVTNDDQTTTTTTYKAYNYPNRGNVYGGGCGTDKYYVGTIPPNHTADDGEGDKYNHLAGIVYGNATVTIDGGHVVHNVYGAGAMGSVGKITNYNNLDDQDANDNYLYKHVAATDDGKESYYNFGLSWPYEFTYDGTTTGQTTVTISGGAIIGVNVVTDVEADKPTGGHVFGAARGGVAVGTNDIADQRYEEAKQANVRESQVTIGTTNGSSQPTIYGSVYGGGEDGHVYEDTYVTINKGTIAHTVFGGGKGTSTFKTTLWTPGENNSHGTLANQDAHSWIAGKVFGNTHVTMYDGTVGYFIYGGGNMASVGKGNYAGGSDDYSTAGYGELGEKNDNGTGGPIWTANPAIGTYAYHFANSGTTNVNVYGGRVGPALETDIAVNSDGLPYGSVFGGSRGKAAASVQLSPRYRYVPDFFLGYVNNTIVTLGDANKINDNSYNGPTIRGSVYGGGQDGHVRNSTHVTINKAQITGQGDNDGRSGHVFGAGSGIGTYTENNVAKCNNSSGSVTCTTEVTIKGGTIRGYVYGGGAMASVGPPRTADHSFDEFKDTSTGYPAESGTRAHGSKSYTKVVLEGGSIGGDVYGASRGPSSSFLSLRFPNNSYNAERYATDIWSEVVMSSGSTAVVNGSVYGGGEGGIVKQNTKVDLLGGTIKGDAYGGGKGALGTDGTATGPNAIKANVGGDVDVTLDGTAFWINYYADNANTTDLDESTIVKSGRVFGCNNLNGSPQGNVTVTVNKTVEGNTRRTYNDTEHGDLRKSKDTDDHFYELAAVYGGGNLSPYTATGKKTHVIIYGCDDTSILTVYGGGNAASVPETDVDIYSAYEIGSVFGGGNGKDSYTLDGGTNWTPNSGADVNGDANTMLYGGTIHEAYGGSNEQGTISGSVFIDIVDVPKTDPNYCKLDVAKVVGAGKNADVNGDLIIVMGCKPSEKIPLVYGGADNANVNGNVELTITSGNFGKVFGGNNEGGALRGHIKLNIEETGSCETPITIDELYLGGNDAAYSRFGYYVKTTTSEGDGTGVGDPAETAVLSDNGKLIFMPRTSESDRHLPVDTYTKNAEGTWTWTVKQIDAFDPYAEPELNVISCTRIDNVFGGGFGSHGTMYANPTVNINMIPGTFANNGTVGVPAVMTAKELTDAEKAMNPQNLGIIGDVYGAGNAAAVIGNPTVNIGTETTVYVVVPVDRITVGTTDVSGYYTYNEATYTAATGTAQTGVTYYALDNETGEYSTADVEDGASVSGYYTLNDAGYYQATGTAVAGTTYYEQKTVLGAYITGNVYGGGNQANVTGDTHVNVCGTQIPSQTSENGYTDTFVDHSTTIDFAVSIGNSVYGGGNVADVLGNTFVTFADGYVFNGIFGGGYSGSVGEFTTSEAATDWEHSASDTRHKEPCIGKPTACTAGGTCYVVVSGGQIGPVEVATQGMNRKTNGHGDPVPHGWVWGGGCGLVEDPKDDPDTHFKTYVNNTDVTIKRNAFILESIIGGGEFGRVLNNTLVKIEGGQIGVGENQVTDGKPVAYTADQWTEAEGAVRAGDASRIKTIAAAMPACSTFPYGRNTAGENETPNWVYDTYDPFADEWKTAHQGSDKYPGGSTDNASDGKTWIGCVFAGGSGYMPYKKVDAITGAITDYAWVKSAGWVGGNAEVRISGGHILSNVYGGNEYTDVKGTCTVKMSGGTVGVPRTVEQIMGNPMIGYIYGAGKGDPRVYFNKVTNVEDVEVEITGGTVFGSVYGGGEDGHVLRDVKLTIENTTVPAQGEGQDPTTITPHIGTWGTSYVDGNVFGGGRGFTGEAYTAGNVAGSVKVDIKGGTMLGSVYGGGRMASVGYGLYDEGATGYGEMRDDDKYDDGTDGSTYFTKGRGHIDITISGGTIGNNFEYIMPKTGSGGNTPTTITETDFTKWSTTEGGDWDKWKAYNNIHKTEFDTTTGQLMHTKGGNVFAGGMGNLYEQDGKTNIHLVDWWKLGCVRSTKLTITGGTIKSSVYGGGELGQVVGHHTVKDAQGNTVYTDANNSIAKVTGTEITIQGSNTTIGTEVKDASNKTLYTYGSVFGGGYGSLLDEITVNNVTSKPKFIAGLVKEDTNIDMQNGAVKASIYGGGEMASVGESITSGQTTTVTGNTYVTVSDGTVGIAPISLSDDTKRYFGGAKMGNVYGGGSGHGNTVRSGQVFMNSNVAISGGTIYHNVYGGGAYGTIGDFIYTEDPNENNKVNGVESRKTANTGVATVTITGGTIGYDGKENGMVFGSSRGDINAPGKRDDHTAWVYDTHVTIGTSGSQTGPQINGTVYGSGENGHVFNDAEVTVNSGTVGIYNSNDAGYRVTSGGKTYEGAAYPYRGNVYGGGCGTDKYYSNPEDETHDGNGQLYNTLAGIVYGNATVNIRGGHVVRNVYGAGAMGSVGRTITTTDNDVTTTTVSGGTTTINVSGGTIGVDGTDGVGNVFGAARGDEDAIINEAALVRKNTSVSVTGGTIKGNVYGGGELGCVGTFTVSPDMRTFTWQNIDGITNTTNTTANSANKNTGVCNVAVDGSTAVINGHVYGAGKGKEDTFWCEKGIAYSTNVNISNGTVNGNVYGGGEVGRVETDSQVKIGLAPEEEGGKSEPSINGSVFGGGAGVETHGYSALVRGNTTVIVDEDAHVSHSVYGGGEIASVGRYGLDEHDMPSILQGGGYCYVTVQGNAEIGEDVFGAGKGVTPAYRYAVSGSYDDRMNNSKRMVPYSPYNEETHKGHKTDEEKKTWDYFEQYPTDYSGIKFVWEYFKEASDYSTYLETLALATHPEVTIDGDATVSGSVFGGGELGLTKGSVIVNIQGGTIAEDVYGGGSLANTNTTSLVDLDGDGKTETVHPTTTVNLSGGTINRNVYGGGLGQLAKAAVTYQAAVPYADVDEYNTDKGTSLTAEQFEALSDAEKTKTPAVEAQAAVTAVEAKVYGNVSVNLNEPTTPGDDSTYGNCVVKGTIFGCNNLNGSPQSLVTVHIYKTVGYDENHTKDSNKGNSKFDLKAVYGGGNLAAYYPDDATARETAKANVIIEGCQLTSIGSVYGGGNAASVPATEVTVNSAYEIGEVFGGGNGKDNVSYDGGVTMVKNPGANVGYRNYSEWNAQGEVVDASDADTKEKREAYAYGVGKTHATIYGGTVHKVYGGSNTRGNVRVEARTTLEDALQCTFNVGEAYGGGNNAPMDGDAVLEIGCISGMEKAYGGAANADVNGNVVLNITNGTYGQVFGGNDLGGNITGSITVNIEETGCRPVIIGELYGGGNLAGYSIYGYKKVTETDETTGELVQVWRPRESSTDSPAGVELSIPATIPESPQVNVKSFTSIGTVYGGGYGGPATMVGSPEVNINVMKGKYAETYNGNDNVIADNARIVGSTVTTNASLSGYGSGYPVPSHAKGAIGAINNVFGGGNAAKVIGTPHVNIGTLTGEVITLASKPIEDSEGKAPTDEGWIPSYQLATVKGVDIRGNVYGAGNNAPVTGDTEVVIGKNNDVKTYSFTSYSASTGGEAWSSGIAQTTGKYVTLGDSKLAEVEILTNGKYGEYVGKKFYVNPESSGRLQLFDAEQKNPTSLWVSINPFVYKTYTFESYSASSGGTQYSTGTAAPTGNFKVFDGNEYMQIVVLTNGEASWVGKTFYVPANAETNGNARTQLHKANGDPVNVWVSISEP